MRMCLTLTLTLHRGTRNSSGHSLFMYRRYDTASPAMKRELLMTTKGCPTGQHTHQRTCNYS